MTKCIQEPIGSDETVWDFDGARRHHILQGLRLSPSERLRWLEETVEEMRRLQGLASKGRRVGDDEP